MLGLTCLQLNFSVFKIATEYNKFELDKAVCERKR